MTSFLYSFIKVSFVGKMELSFSGVSKFVVFLSCWSFCLLYLMENRITGHLAKLDELENVITQIRSDKSKEDHALPTADLFWGVPWETESSHAFFDESEKEKHTMHFLAAAGASQVQSEQAKQEALVKPRKLAGAFMTSATSNAVGVGCVSFSSTTTFEVDADTCSSSLKCPPCFISTGAAITINIVDCDDFYKKTGTAMAATDMVEILFINAGSGSLTIRSYQTSDTGTLKSEYALAVKRTVTGVCYGSSAGIMHFPADTSSGVTQN